jgi:hypothetical protein
MTPEIASDRTKDWPLRMLWGSRSRPAPLTCMIDTPSRHGIIVSRVLASAISDPLPADEPAVVAHQLVGVEGRRTPGLAPRSCRAAQNHRETPSGLDGSSGLSPRSSEGCRRCCGGIPWSRRAQSCAGIVKIGRIEGRLSPKDQLYHRRDLAHGSASFLPALPGAVRPGSSYPNR